jgi:adenylylsulfate kinase
MTDTKRQEGFTLWFTGWSGAGKTTLAIAIEEALRKEGISFVQRLDGDIVREDLTRDLGFSKEDRDENIRRVAFVASLLSRNGVATLVSFISPYREARGNARRICKNFIEIYVRCNPDILVSRDVKGFYGRAIRGEIRNFTGITDPYEEPETPEIIVDTGTMSVNEARDAILTYLRQKNLFPPQGLAAESSPKSR